MRPELQLNLYFRHDSLEAQKADLAKSWKPDAEVVKVAFNPVCMQTTHSSHSERHKEMVSE